MTKESLTENDSTVKNKKRTRRASHTVADGFAFTIREFTRGMVPDCVGKTRRGRLNNSAYHIKKTAMDWADSFPKKINGVPTGFTPAFREVFKALVWAHLMNRGYAVFSYENLAADTNCHRDTARDAVTFFRARGLLQFKTGKGWGREERRSLANQYTVNFWAFINPETGTIIKPEYHTGKYEWEMTAAVFRARIKEGPYTENTPMVSRRGVASNGVGKKSGPYAENTPMVRGKKRRTSARPYAENTPLYSDNGRGASLPASADATASATPPLKKEFGPLPEQDSDSVKIRFAQLKPLADKIRLFPFGLTELFAGRGSPSFVNRLCDFCKGEIFNSGKAPLGFFEEKPPTNGEKMGRIVICEETRRVDFVNGGDWLPLDKLKEESWLAIEYRVEVSEKLQELQTGV